MTSSFLFRHRGTRWAISISSLALGLGAVHCGSADDASDGGGLPGDLEGADRDSFTLDPNLGGPTHGSQGSLHPLCGSGSCVPDDDDSCAVPDGMGGMGGTASGAGGAAGFAGALTANPGELEDSGTACHLQFAEDCQEPDCQLLRQCGESGAGRAGQPCLAAEDCRPGLVCAGEGPTGVCRSYCCRGAETSCDDESYCDVRSVVGEDDVRAPVCVPLNNCSLTEPFPCPEGQECACGEDRACIVVRLDGSTACAVPGSGELGDACTGTQTGECAYGYVCSLDEGCMALCSTIDEVSGCPEGATCQNPSDFPSDLGVCVGGR